MNKDELEQKYIELDARLSKIELYFKEQERKWKIFHIANELAKKNNAT